MNDMFDAVKRAANGPGSEMGKRLQSADVARTSAEAVTRGRRWRAARQGGIALATAGAIVMGAWFFPAMADDSEPITPATWDGSMTDAGIGEVGPLPDVYEWQQNQGAEPPLPFCTGLYDPPTEPGLTIRDQSVRALGIGIETTLRDVPTRLDGQPIALTSDYLPTVDATISWFGDRDLQVMGYVVFVYSDGVMRSTPSAWSNLGGTSRGEAFEARRYQAWDNRTKVSVNITAFPYDCVLHGPDGTPLPMLDAREAPRYEVFAQYDGDYTLHTVFQVSDETGVPLATFVDAVEVAAVSFHLEEQLEKWTSLEEEYEQAVEVLRQNVATEGIALSDTINGMGKRNVAETCEAVDLLWEEEGPALPVLDIGRVALAFPTTLSRADLGGSITFDSPPAMSGSLVPWYWGAEYLVLRRVTPEGVEHAAFGVTVVPGEGWGDAGIEGVIEGSLELDGSLTDERGCGNAATLASLEPGVYQAAMVVTGTPWSPEDWLMFDGSGGRVQDFWVDLGEITITE